MVAEYTIAGESFVANKPRIWSPTKILGNTGFTAIDLAPDGKRFVIFQSDDAGQEDKPRLTLLLNFFEEIRRRSPGR